MIKAIIIDDEERSQRVLKNLLENFCEGIEVVDVCANVPEGVLAINKHNPDVVFCDIEMPNYSGLELLSFFNDVNFEIIFATGYSEYAIQAFEVSAVDYLLKPIQLEKLEVAIEKLKNRLHRVSMNDRLEALKENVKEDAIQKIAVPVSDGLIFINIENICLLEAEGAYTNMWLKDKSQILVSKRMRFFEDLLSRHKQFYRAHRSHLVNINYIEKYSRKEGYLTLENKKVVKVARDKKSEFEEYITNIKL